jgi:EAL domain-containing protein (putative c-di-GMP-specific phosphodiesterase class I)
MNQDNRNVELAQPWLNPAASIDGLTFLRGEEAAHAPRIAPARTPPKTAHRFGDMALTLHPRHALAGGALRAAEASLRWGASGAVLMGGADRELSSQMSVWLLETACREAQAWNSTSGAGDGWFGVALRHLPSVMVSVDMPARALREGRLLDQTRATLDKTGLLPFLLEIELPEYAVTDGTTEALLEMSALRDVGVGLALDHFGSVSASLRLLQRLPLTAVKLDPCLIADLVHDRESRATVAAAITLAHALNTTVVATGVETVLQRDILADMNCDDAQGPLFGGALTAELFRDALMKSSAVSYQSSDG